MILLNPNDTPNVMNLILRETGSNGNVILTITEEGRGETESFTIAPNLSNDNYAVLSCQFTILKEDTIYNIVVKSNYELPSSYIGRIIEDATLDYTILYKGKAYSTSSTDVIHTINTGVFTTNTENDSESYTIHE